MWRTSSASAESRTRLGRFRWVAERTLAWLARLRRLVIRYERLEAMHQALLDLGCASSASTPSTGRPERL